MAFVQSKCILYAAYIKHILLLNDINHTYIIVHVILTKSNICLNIKACQTCSRFADQSYLVNPISDIELFTYKLHENVY